MCLSILLVFKFNFYASAAFASVSAASAFSVFSASENESGRRPVGEHHHFRRLVEELEHEVCQQPDPE
jgi:hypothetical protein